jgi:putative ABC transport system permease protein
MEQDGNSDDGCPQNAGDLTVILAKMRSFFRGLFLRSNVETDMAREMRFHIETRASDLAARGIDADEARRRAVLEFGSLEKYKEEIRGARGLRLLDELRADLVYGLRSLRRSPSFTVVATVSLALGIGANTLIFTLLDSTFLRPLRYRDANRLVVVWSVPEKNRDTVNTSSVSTYFELRDRTQSFESIGAFNGGGCGIRSLGSEVDGVAPERIFGQCVSPSFFSVLGLNPQIGRTFTDAEDQVGNVAAVVLISNALWKTRFGGDPNILGKSITLNRVPTTVIGVLPADFELFKDPNSEATRTPNLDFIIPLELTPTQVQSKVGGLTIVGRLKQGVSVEQAAAEVTSLAKQLAVSDPDRHQDLSARVDAFRRAAYGTYRSPLLILEGAVAFVLLIGCANVAGLLLARAASRRTEVALRMALGGSRSRIIRQLVTENLPVALLGGTIGWLLAAGGLILFTASAPRDFPRLEQVSLDFRVLGFTALTVLVTGVISAIFPAIQTARVALMDSLKDSGRSATSNVNRVRLRSLLVTGQIALAVMLLIGAGLMIHSFVRILEKDLGADTKNLLTFDFRLTQAETAKPFGRYRGLGLWDISPVPAQRVERVLERLQQLRGVSAVAAVNLPPFRNQTMTLPFLIEGDEVQNSAQYLAVTRGFFGVMKIPLLRGRDFTDRDTENSPPVVIINETLARQYFPNVDPIGKRLSVDWVPDEPVREIVGIVGDTAVSPLQKKQEPALYLPHLQQTSKFTGPYWFTRSGMYFVMRTNEEPLRIVPSLKAAVSEIDRNTPVAEVRTVEETIHNEIRNLQLYMLLLGIFGAVATVLAASGIYGVMAYSVAERGREIGIRIAVGAGARDVLKMILRQAIVIIGIGLAAGLSGALALSRLFQAALLGEASADPLTYAAVSLLLLITAGLACLIPTRRAVTVDPTTCLRNG